MRGFTIGLALIAILGAAGCSSAGSALGLSPPAYSLTDPAKAVRAANTGPVQLPKETAKALLPAYLIEPGDTLLVTSSDLDSPVRLPGDQVVLQDGTIDLGRYGRPVVAGKTITQIEQEVRTHIQQQIDAEAAKAKPKAEPAERESAHINVRLVGRASKVYYVIGEVNAPGAFPISGRETVLDGVFAAGNLTRKASTKNLILSRPTSPDGCRIVLPICWDDITQLADPTTNYQLMPGDRIYVASKGMFDDLFPKRRKPDCLPCNRPQTPCTLAGGCTSNGSATPVPLIGTPLPADEKPAAR